MGLKVKNGSFLPSSVTSYLCNPGWLTSPLLAWFLHQKKLQHIPATWSFGALQKEATAYATQIYLVSVVGMPGILVLQLNGAFRRTVLDFEGFSPLYACIFMRWKQMIWVVVTPQHPNPLCFSQPFGLVDRNDLRAPDVIGTPTHLLKSAWESDLSAMRWRYSKYRDWLAYWGQSWQLGVLGGLGGE